MSGMFGAMFSGVTGLRAQSTSLAIISDNIANLNTIGYKATTNRFSTLVTQQATATSYSPGGVLSRPAQLIDRQGLLEASESATDLAITGHGFFIVNSHADGGTSGVNLFTRAGSFTTDNDGNLVNTAGFYLQGWPTDANGVIVPGLSTSTLDDLQTVNVNVIKGSAQATSNIAIGANLPATAALGETFGTNVVIYDSLGMAHNLGLTWIKAAPNTWDIQLTAPTGSAVVTLDDATGAPYAAAARLDFTAQPIDGDTIVIDGTSYTFSSAGGGVAIGTDLATTVANLVAAVADPRLTQGTGTQSSSVFFTQAEGGLAVTIDASGTSVVQQSTAFTVPELTADSDLDGFIDPALIFAGNGTPAVFNVKTLDVIWGNGADPSMGVTLDLGTVGLGDGLTQFSDTFATNFIEQNGVPFGVFSGVAISDDGIVSALFDNGEVRAIYRVPIATFQNPNALGARSGNVFQATTGSGDPLVNLPGVGPAGRVAAGSLEASTVDLAEEFTKMIVSQRAFSASSKIITTADEMLDELTRIKR